jgi:hypothetical protein
MATLFAKLRAAFTDRPRPDAVFGLSPRNLGGVLAGSGGRASGRRFVLPLDPRGLAPSFDKPNGAGASCLPSRIEEGKRALGLSGGTVTLLIPEPCARIFVLAAESLPESEEEREAFIRWRVAKQMPVMPDDLRLAADLSSAPGPAKIIVAAARESVIREYEDTFLAAGLRPGCVSIPSLGLANLVDRDAGANGVLVDSGSDHLSLLAAMNSEWTLYRQKAIGPALTAGERMGLIVQEAENTVHFLEDREKKRIVKIWVHSGDGEDGPELVAGLESALALPAEWIDYDAPGEWTARERSILAPLVGQLA